MPLAFSRAPRLATLTLAALCATPAAPAQDWTVLQPAEMSSEAGADFQVLDDGSILVQGENADRDVYLLEFDTDLAAITAFRLEVLPDERLPKNGPGRAGQGNFVLSNLAIEAGPPRSRSLKEVRLKDPSANFSQDVKHVSGMIDGGMKSGWSIFPKMGQRHEAVVVCREPIEQPRGARIRARMDFQFGGGHNLGRFRLSATAAGQDVRAEGAPEPDPWHEFQPRVNLAIDRGVDLLLDQQELDGSWHAHQDGYRTGMTGLALYTLLKCGLDKKHPAVARAAGFVRTQPSIKTYETACVLMALATLGDPQDQDRIEELAEALESWQRPDGGFAYPDGEVDLSNIQYAALGLRAAASRGVKIRSDTWEGLVERVKEHQEKVRNPYGPAGFAYRPGGEVTGSMTAAGVGVLAICEEQLPRLRSKVRQSMEQGLVWLGEYFSPRDNPTATGPHPAHRLYYLYGVERVGGLTGKAKLGEHEWYREGARFLVEGQQGDGAWESGQPTTCFALLFLNRATAASTGDSAVLGAKSYGQDDPAKDVNLRAAGDTPLAVWISSFGEAAREDLAVAGEEGQGPRVEKVEYFMTGEDGGDEPVRLAEVKGDPTRPAGAQRFPANVSFRGNGRYKVWAEVTVVDPLAREGDEETTLVLSSDAITVGIHAAQDPMLVQYATDGARNAMAESRVLSRSSSDLNDGNRAEFATDNLLSRGWCSADNDPTPSLTLDLERPVRADTIVFSQHSTRDDGRTGRAKRIRVELNGKHRFELDLDPDPDRKTEHQFGKAARIQRISILVLEQTGATTDKRGVGFAEVELRDSRRR